MNKVFSDNAWRDFMYWVKEDRKIAKKINELLKDIERNDNEGLGCELIYQVIGVDALR